MSTRISLKYKKRSAEVPGYHLYEDALDSFFDDEQAEQPVYLQLDGVQVEVVTLKNDGAVVTVELPRGVARELGLIGD